MKKHFTSLKQTLILIFSIYLLFFFLIMVLLKVFNFLQNPSSIDPSQENKTNQIFFVLIFVSLVAIGFSFFIVWYRTINPLKQLNKINENYISIIESNNNKEVFLQRFTENVNLPYIKSNDIYGDIARNIYNFTKTYNIKLLNCFLYTEDITTYTQRLLEAIKTNITIYKNNNEQLALLKIQDQITLIETIIFKLRDITRIYTKSDDQIKEKINVYEMVKNIVSTYSNASITLKSNNINFIFNIQPTHLESIIRVLIDNAIETSSNIEVSIKSSNKLLKIICKDNGIGIQNPDIIFNNFYSNWNSFNNEKHLGLGLPRLNAIVKSHKGHITIRSRSLFKKKNKGTKFIIELPNE